MYVDCTIVSAQPYKGRVPFESAVLRPEPELYWTAKVALKSRKQVDERIVELEGIYVTPRHASGYIRLVS